MKVKFVKDANILVEGKPETLFSQDDVQDLNPSSADRWIRRGVAVEVSQDSRQSLNSQSIKKKSSKKRAAKPDSAANR